jgi:hypothetical protein
MMPSWLVEDLVALVREKYPAWDGFAHAPFVQDEVAYKRATAVKTRQLLSRTQLDPLLAQGATSEIISRIEKIGRDNNLLWLAQPQRGDLAALYLPHIDQTELVAQLRELWHGEAFTPDRIEAWTGYCTAVALPNKWPFATYYLFFLRPHAETFIKPTVAKWFLKFLGMGELYTSTPTADMYERYKKNCHTLLASLKSYAAQDMIDIQSFIWVAHQAHRERIGSLDSRAQIALDIPPALTMHDQANPYQIAIAPTRPQTSTDLAHRVGYPVEVVQQWQRALRRKGQLIFYGPPGTGKTFVAQALAEQWAGASGLVELVQFHPAYDYADFIGGLRPQTAADGMLRYTWTPGRLLDFCQRVAELPGNHVLIIDEINRANLSQVFGELFYLLEYREAAIPLASGERFQLPPNVYLLGTMNTADRSIALVDHALRRRFAFIWLPPNYELLRQYHRQTDFDPEGLIGVLGRLNEQIQDPHYAVGVSYFLRADVGQVLADIWQLEIEPYIEEYFFRQPAQVAQFRWAVVAQELF